VGYHVSPNAKTLGSSSENDVRLSQAGQQSSAAVIACSTLNSVRDGTGDEMAAMQRDKIRKRQAQQEA
jgi:hypothetical protein